MHIVEDPVTNYTVGIHDRGPDFMDGGRSSMDKGTSTRAAQKSVLFGCSQTGNPSRPHKFDFIRAE